MLPSKVTYPIEVLLSNDVWCNHFSAELELNQAIKPPLNNFTKKELPVQVNSSTARRNQIFLVS